MSDLFENIFEEEKNLFKEAHTEGFNYAAKAQENY